MSNPRGDVRAALATVHARCLIRGIDSADYATLLEQVHDWDAWWDGWTAMGERYLRLADDYDEQGWSVSAGQARTRAGVAFHFGKALAVRDDERYRDLTVRSVDAVRRGGEQLDPTFERVEVPFDGHRIVGNLRRPAGAERPPLVLLVPGTESTKEEFPRWEEEYLARGMATLSMDGPGQGESGFELRIRHDYETAVAAMLDALEGRDDLDLSRVGAAGVSLGGYYAIRAAAFEPRLKTVLANCGPWSLGEAWDEISALYVAKYVWNLGASDEQDARGRAGALTLEGVAERVDVPVVVVYGADDKLFSPERHGRHTAESLPRGELWMFEGGNHGVTNFATEHIGPGADWILERI
jgi:2,6-dihydroxypseudooxynicotine hydrolase